MKTKGRRKDKINVITIGCSKNVVDSEVLITQLAGNNIDVQLSDSNNNNLQTTNTKSSFRIKSGDETVASIDNEGTITGSSLSVQDIKTNTVDAQEGTFSGTLRANKILTHFGDLDEKLQSLESSLSSVLTDSYSNNEE